MTLSVSLSPQTEARLRERAAASGQEPATYASQLLERAVSGVSLEQLLAPLRAQFASTGSSDEALTAQIAEARNAYRKQR